MQTTFIIIWKRHKIQIELIMSSVSHSVLHRLKTLMTDRLVKTQLQDQTRV